MIVRDRSVLARCSSQHSLSRFSSAFPPRRLRCGATSTSRDGRTWPPRSSTSATSSSSEIAAFARTPIFERLTAHPNAQRYDALIARYAKANELDIALVKAVVAAESGYEPTAVSEKGALGLMQVIPETAARYGVVDDKRRTVAEKLFDPATNLRIGTRYLRDLLTLFDDDLELALAAYNAGEGAVQRYDRRIPPYAETQDYVKLVTQLYALYKPPPAMPPSRVTIPRKRSDER
jgi:soluble lytic murein transglycosylase-like protein